MLCEVSDAFSSKEGADARCREGIVEVEIGVRNTCLHNVDRQDKNRLRHEVLHQGWNVDLESERRKCLR